MRIFSFLFPFGIHKSKTTSSTEKGQALGMWSVQKVILNEVGSTSSLPPKTVDSAESLELAADMRLALLQIKGSHMDDSGKRVDYAAMRKSPVYRDTYLSAAQKLATIDLEALSANQRKAFFLNTYNSLVIHGMVEDNLGKVVTESLGRLKFYASQSYNISGLTYSLNDIENGVLRGNRPGAAPGSSIPFQKDDPRLTACVECDPRIHFALNCGAMGCPAIASYDADTLDEDLAMATETFTALGSGVKVDTEKGIVTLSMLFKWYAGDFGEDESGVLRWITSNADPETREIVSKLLADPKQPPRVEFEPYDWSLNSA